jgi:hypothetical protein
MTKCPHCGSNDNSATALKCEGCGESLPVTHSSVALQRDPPVASQQPDGHDLARQLADQINEAVAELRSSPPTPRLKTFVIGVLSVPTIGLAYLLAKFFGMLGRSGASPKRFKLHLHQDLAKVAAGFKSDSGMRSVHDKGRDALIAYEAAEHASRMSFVYGMATSAILFTVLFVSLSFGVKSAGDRAANRAAAEGLKMAQEARKSEERAASAINQNSDGIDKPKANPTHPGALVIAISREPKISAQQTKALEDMVGAKVAGLGFNSITRDMAVDSISKALKDPSLTERKAWLEAVSNALNRPDSIPESLREQFAKEESTIRLAQAIKADLIIVVTVESSNSEIKNFKGNELAPAATSTAIHNLVINYSVAYAATGRNALGGTVNVSRTEGNSENLSSTNDGLVNAMLGEGAALVVARITSGQSKDNVTGTGNNSNASTSEGPEKKRVCIGPIIALKSVQQKVASRGKSAELEQTIEALDAALVDQISQGRKLEVVARKSGLKSILAEQELGASGRFDSSSGAQAFKLAGAQYLVVSVVTDFAWGNETIKFNNIGVAANREAVRISCSIQIYDTTSGKLVESARFRGQDAGVSRESSVTAEGVTITKITDRLAADIMNRIIDVIYPAKVAAKQGNQITINRGEGAGVVIGQVWTVFALGQEIIDPDTGEKLGRNEAEVGKIRISRVTPKLSFCDSVEDKGIEIGSIARPQLPPEQLETQAVPVKAEVPNEAKPKGLLDKVKGDL